jgi:hypothetical protein
MNNYLLLVACFLLGIFLRRSGRFLGDVRDWLRFFLAGRPGVWFFARNHWRANADWRPG